MSPTLVILIKILMFSLLFARLQTKVLEITQKNLPNVLKFQPDILILYHHPDCKYSINFKLKFTQHFQNANSDNENVGVVDCSQQNNLCASNNITSYPVVKRVYANLTSDLLQADLFLAKVSTQYRQTDQYLASQIANKLKQSPNFIFALFEQEGMPVGEEHKLKNVTYSDRIFYLSQGRVAKTLAGFVKNKPGCWIFELRSQQSGQLYRFECGNTYQSSFQLEYQLQKYLNETSIKKPHKPTQIELTDQSNHQNQTILGYKQFIYWLKNYNLQLEISTHTKISICKFIYLWSQHCEHCNYEADMKSIKRSIDYLYEKNPYKGDENLTMKYQIHSYDIQNNRLIINSKDLIKIAALNDTQMKSSHDNHPLLVPNVLSICFSTANSRDLANNVFMQVNKLDKIIASENIDKFVHKIIQSQHQLISKPLPQQKSQTTQTQL